MHVFSLQYCQISVCSLWMHIRRLLMAIQSLCTAIRSLQTEISALQRYNYKKAKSKFQGTYFLFLSVFQGFLALSRGVKRCGSRAIKALWLTLFYVLKEV